MKDYKIKKISSFNLVAMKQLSDILYACGKDMAIKYNLHHWDNNRIKTFMIAIYSSLKNDTFLVEDENKRNIATFQVYIKNKKLHFGKLVTYPLYSGKGVGSYCMKSIENLAWERGCNQICMEVYDKSLHALDFYMHKGYQKCGEVKILKYTEIKMKKTIEV